MQDFSESKWYSFPLNHPISIQNYSIYIRIHTLELAELIGGCSVEQNGAVWSKRSYFLALFIHNAGFLRIKRYSFPLNHAISIQNFSIYIRILSLEFAELYDNSDLP